jgi:hypothetical protein
MKNTKIELEFSEHEMADFLQNQGAYMMSGRNENGDVMVTDLHAFQSTNREILLKDCFLSVFKSKLLSLK